MVKILLWHDYRGRLTREQVIAAGEYDTEHPAIGELLAAYLVANGHADWVAEEVPLEIPPEPELVHPETFPDAIESGEVGGKSSSTTDEAVNDSHKRGGLAAPVGKRR